MQTVVKLVKLFERSQAAPPAEIRLIWALPTANQPDG